MMGCVSCGSVSCSAPPIFVILGAEPALNNLSEIWGPPQSTEVEQLLEEDIEMFIEGNPQALDKNLRTFKRQYVLKSGERIDLLLKDKEGLVVVEMKKGAIGREAFNQITKYLKEVKSESKCKVRGVIVCRDVLPIFEDFFLKKVAEGKIKVYLYSWKFNLRPLQS